MAQTTTRSRLDRLEQQFADLPNPGEGDTTSYHVLFSAAKTQYQLRCRIDQLVVSSCVPSSENPLCVDIFDLHEGVEGLREATVRKMLRASIGRIDPETVQEDLDQCGGFNAAELKVLLREGYSRWSPQTVQMRPAIA